MYTEKILIRKKQLESQIVQIQKELEKMPDGYLRCERNGRYIKWFYYHDGIAEYLSKKQKALAEQLAIRKYKEMQLEELQIELRAIGAYLKCKKKSPCADGLLKDDSLYKTLLTPYFMQYEEEISKWVNEPYVHNPAYPEKLIHKTVAGIMVRSKSEALIVSSLVKNHIPFRYECPLYLTEHILYPDFTILHPKTRKIYYWEHFGKMDDTEYVKITNAKLNTYFMNGMNPANNLIMTFESSTEPLDYEVVDETIHMYFS